MVRWNSHEEKYSSRLVLFVSWLFHSNEIYYKVKLTEYKSNNTGLIIFLILLL